MKKKFFNTPNFLKMPVTGINVSDHSIKIMKLSCIGGEVKINDYADVRIDDGIVVSGEIKDDKGFVKALVSLKEKYDIDFINASIPEENAYLFKTTLPNMPIRNVREALAFQLEEHVPLKLEEAIFDFNIIRNSENSEELELSVTAIPKKFIERYVKVFEEAKMIPLSLEIEAEAIKRAVVGSGDRETYMIVDVGRTRTGISIVSKGELRYTSTVSIGGDAFSEAIQKHLSIPFNKADQIKQNIGFASKTNDEGLYKSLALTASALEDEIKKRTSYWNDHVDQKQKDRKPVKGIILCGGNASIPGFSEHIALSVNVPVKVANVWGNLFSLEDNIPEIDFKHSLSYATVIGLSMKNISF